MGEFATGVTVCDAEGIIVGMIDHTAQMLQEQGGRALLGSNVLDRHRRPARTRLAHLMEPRRASRHNTDWHGCRKLIRLAPWFRDGEHAGFVANALALPEAMPRLIRDVPA